MQSAQFALHAAIEQRHWWFVARRRIMRALVEQVVPPGRGGLVVDVGCGTGANLAALAGDYRCVGIDTSAEAIALARQRFPEIDFVCGTAPEDLGGRAGEADLFLLMDVLEHVPDDFEVFSRLLQAASPGSHILITVPADLRLWTRHDESFGHFRRYDQQRLASLWSGLPVRVRLLSHYNARLYPAIRLVRLLNGLRNQTTGAAGTDFAIPPRPLNTALEGLFAGEADVLVDLLRGGRRRGYRHGVSLVALVEREPGEIGVRTRPASVAADRFDPRLSEPLAAAV